MTTAAATTTTQDPILIAIPDQPLSSGVTDYLNHLASQHRQTPLLLTLKIHPLSFSESLARELAAHERDLLPPDERRAAHECGDLHYPHETALARTELCNLIAEMAIPLAEATLAHHLLLILTIGKNLPPPYAIDRMAICASFDSAHGILIQRFAPDREMRAPDNVSISAGMTLVCEPLETSFYRLPDDKRYRNSCGLLMSDPVYNWTLQALLFLHMARAGTIPGADAHDIAQQLSAQARFVFRLLALLNPESDHFASLGSINVQQLRTSTASNPVRAPQKIVAGRFASSNGAVQIRNFEHQAGGQMLGRNAQQSHHPLPHHAHAQEPASDPE